jgi:hypothetical protein
VNPGFVQDGLTTLPGSASASAPAMAQPPRSMVYDDYFPSGTAPTTPCDRHGLPSIPGINGIADGGSAGVVSASYVANHDPARETRQREAAIRARREFD